jgi:hypothetical protein
MRHCEAGRLWFRPLLSGCCCKLCCEAVSEPRYSILVRTGPRYKGRLDLRSSHPRDVTKLPSGDRMRASKCCMEVRGASPGSHVALGGRKRARQPLEASRSLQRRRAGLLGAIPGPLQRQTRVREPMYTSKHAGEGTEAHLCCGRPRVPQILSQIVFAARKFAVQSQCWLSKAPSKHS